MQHYMASSAPGSPGGLAGQRRVGRQHRRGYWAKACSPARPFAVGSAKDRLRMPNSTVDLPDRPWWAAVGTSSQPQQAQKKEAPLMLLFLHCALRNRASEPPTYMVDDLRGQELPS